MKKENLQGGDLPLKSSTVTTPQTTQRLLASSKNMKENIAKREKVQEVSNFEIILKDSRGHHLFLWGITSNIHHGF